eukprot:gene11760-15737_t
MGSLTWKITNEQIKSWKLWPGLISTYDEENGETIVGFTEAIENIWRHQNPVDCSKAKFLIAEGWPQGFGSEVHILGIGLALALNMNRIYVMNPNGPLSPIMELDNRWQVNNSYCNSIGKKTHECYYEPWTNCSIDIILGNKTIQELKQNRHITFTSDTDIFQNNQYDMSERIILMENRGDVDHPFPFRFNHIMNCSYMDINNYLYWWRAVSTAYILRPNMRTIQNMKKFKHENKHHLNHFDYEKDVCIGAYIRKGDKHVEMKLPNTNTYLYLAKYMFDRNMIRNHTYYNNNIHEILYDTNSTHNNNHINNHNNNHNNHNIHNNNNSHHKIHNNGILYVGSEDPYAINEAVEWGKHHHWQIMYTNLFDRHSISTHLNYTQQEILKKNQSFVHHDLEYFSMIFNLDNILKCTAFICATGSNYCRVIEELRATVANKANYHFADPGACENNEACIDEHLICARKHKLKK